MIAYVHPAVSASEPAMPMPGLFDVVLEDGQEYRDLTTGQVMDLAAREDWQITPQRSSS